MLSIQILDHLLVEVLRHPLCAVVLAKHQEENMSGFDHTFFEILYMDPKVNQMTKKILSRFARSAFGLLRSVLDF